MIFIVKCSLVERTHRPLVPTSFVCVSLYSDYLSVVIVDVGDDVGPSEVESYALDSACSVGW